MPIKRRFRRKSPGLKFNIGMERVHFGYKRKRGLGNKIETYDK
jgi:hypothetical protein